MKLPYTQYAHSEHYNENRYVYAVTNGYDRVIRTGDLDSEMDAHPELMLETEVSFISNK